MDYIIQYILVDILMKSHKVPKNNYSFTSNVQTTQCINYSMLCHSTTLAPLVLYLSSI